LAYGRSINEQEESRASLPRIPTRSHKSVSPVAQQRLDEQFKILDALKHEKANVKFSVFQKRNKDTNQADVAPESYIVLNPNNESSI